LDLQAKLLRVLQEGEIRPLGSNTTRKVNVRVISAASASLKQIDSKVIPLEFRKELDDLRQYPQLNKSLTESLADYE